MDKILGLDLGTNSIGWAVVNRNDNGELTGIEAAGSRIIPMDAEVLGKFNSGASQSQTAERTGYRGVRRLRERCLLRRERLHRVLDIIGALPQHYSEQLTRYGKFQKETEPKLAWRKNQDGQMEFIFMDSFNEMLDEFRREQPQMVADGHKVPYDWTIYYLRHKALTRALTKQELAWILLNFNQKRGYYQLRGEDDGTQKDGKRMEFHSLRVVKVEDSGEKRGNDTWYNVHLENGWIYRRSSRTPLDWEGKVRDFIVTTEIDENGNEKLNKDGEVKRSFRAPGPDDWTLLKVKTEQEIAKSKETVGSFIYNSLLHNPERKIIGQLVRTVERKFYREELVAILETQKRFIPELQDMTLYERCAEELYQSNESHRDLLVKRADFTHLFVSDILFYQRPLKSKKSLIANCPYEKRYFTVNGELKEEPMKCIAKSNPYYQEFRLWQFVANLRIYKKDADESEVTNVMLPTVDDRVELFCFLNDKKTIEQKQLLAYPKFGISKKQIADYRWNYVEDKAYPCNETRNLFLTRIEKAGLTKDWLTQDREYALWHLVYSVEDKIEYAKAIRRFAKKNDIGDNEVFIAEMEKMPTLKKEYGAYSEKAVKKMLAVMRMGKMWNKDAVGNVKSADECVSESARKALEPLHSIEDYSGLNTWQACYAVYGRHSEATSTECWESPDKIDEYLKQFKQHSMRNPIVEQVVCETLRTVRDVWRKYAFKDGKSEIAEIHLELGREMKKTADERKRMTTQIAANEATNIRIKQLLIELLNPEMEVDDVRPYSPSQQEILRIYEDGAVNNGEPVDDEIKAIMDKLSQTDKKKMPTTAEVKRYKLWLEQRYQSPYTGEMIPLGKLFTPAYEIEHVIPQSRYFDDSMSNKVICEAEVNKLKDCQLGLQFIKAHAGEKVTLSMGRTVKVFTEEEYKHFVDTHYKDNRAKMKKLMLEDVPEEFIQRQMNDSRYISKFVMSLLSNIVREENEQGKEETSTSKNLIPCTGQITDTLKKDWGMNDVWNQIILPRFQRLNDICGVSHFTEKTTNGHEIPTVPIELQKGFQKKRIDHRHHAMDAIVIACATRDHVNLLNNEAALPKNKDNRSALQHKLRRQENITTGEGKKITIFKEFLKPWDTFTQDARAQLDSIIVSFKQNLRIINKMTNYYERYEDGQKKMVKQTQGNGWAIRKPLHKETVSGLVNMQVVRTVKLAEAMGCLSSIVNRDLRAELKRLIAEGKSEKDIIKHFKDDNETWADVNVNKVEVYCYSNDTRDKLSATTKSITDLQNEKTDKINDAIDCVTDSGIRAILRRHLEQMGGDPAVAFSADGVEEMNRNIVALNNGKRHCPIYKYRKMEIVGNKFAIGTTGNKATKYVEAAKGTNLFFAIFVSEKQNRDTNKIEQVRSYLTIPLSTMIDCQKKFGKEWDKSIETYLKDNGMVTSDVHLLFIISPNDLVYLPTQEQLINGIKTLDKTRIYKFVDPNSNKGNFVPFSSANVIFSMNFTDQKKNGISYPIQDEFGVGSQASKNPRAVTGEMIKETCLPIKVDRLGNIVELNGQKL